MAGNSRFVRAVFMVATAISLPMAASLEDPFGDGSIVFAMAFTPTGLYRISADGGDPFYQPLTEDELTQLRRVVQTAVGLNSVRGDQIEIVNMQFNQPEVSEPAPFVTNWMDWVTRYGGKAFLFIMFGVILLTILSNILNLAGVSPYFQQILTGVVLVGTVLGLLVAWLGLRWTRERS